MDFMKLERTQEISITHDDIDTTVQNLIEDNGFAPDHQPDADNIIIDIIKTASAIELDDDEADEWRSEMDTDDYKLLIDEFWDSFEKQAIELMKDDIKERKKWDKMGL